MMLLPHIAGGSPVISCIMAHSRRASSRRRSSGTWARNASTEASVGWVAMTSEVRLDQEDLGAAERDVGVEGELLVRYQPEGGVAAGGGGHRDTRLARAGVCGPA